VYSHVADQLALPLDATPPGSYRQQGASSLQRLFRAHFTELVTRYDDEFAKRLGKFRLERITKAVERFLACGDYRRGIARITCTNPDSGLEYFRPFSCSVFHPLVGPLHRPAQGPPRLLPTRQEASRRYQPPHLRLGARLHNGGRRQADPHSRSRGVPVLGIVLPVPSSPAWPVPGGRL
jgi:hypothetical protein